MTDHRWAFCNDPECLLCATHAPRRDVPAKPEPLAARVSERLSRLNSPGGRAVDWRPTKELTDFVDKHLRASGRDVYVSRSLSGSHIHWAAGPQQAPRPWYLRAATRLFRMQPIHTVRDRVRVQWDRRSWYVGVFVGRDGGDVHLLCLTFVIDWSRHGWLRK